MRCAASSSAPRWRASWARSTTSAGSILLPKLAGQVAAAAIPCAFGVWVDHFTFPFVGAVDLPAWVGMPLTVVWIVAVMNMVNFLDGMDGLASGVCAIAGLTFATLALSLGKIDAAVLSAIVAGACIGFLRHNFFPARIFMGDSGALVLGFILATVSVAGLLKTASTVVLVLPLLDPRRPDHRHVVRGREAAQVPAADLLAPTARISTTGSWTSGSRSDARP